MVYLIICAVALVVSALTLFSGFGLGTLLMPTFAIFFPVEIAIATTAIVHLANNIFKLALVGKMADFRIVLRFAIPASIMTIAGALLLNYFANIQPIAEYHLAGKTFTITAVKLVVAFLLAIFAILELYPRFEKLEFHPKYIPLGGALSGFFGGLSGQQGALRSAFLIRAGLKKESFGFGDTSLITRIMLLETRNTTLLSFLETTLPTGDEDRGLGSGLTMISPGIGLWRDLGKCYALHGFFGLDIPIGGKDDDDPDTTVVYGTALTKTVTSKDTPYFGNLTFFVEFNGSSDIGTDGDTTMVSILPGVRWNLGHEFWLMPGIEFPVIGRDEFDNRVWLSVLKDF